jgi:hypothetical protein
LSFCAISRCVRPLVSTLFNGSRCSGFTRCQELPASVGRQGGRKRGGRTRWCSFGETASRQRRAIQPITRQLVICPRRRETNAPLAERLTPISCLWRRPSLDRVSEKRKSCSSCGTAASNWWRYRRYSGRRTLARWKLTTGRRGLTGFRSHHSFSRHRVFTRGTGIRKCLPRIAR